MATVSAGREIVNKVIKYINSVRTDYPEVTNDMLLDNGAIYYMNGNDGTEFDWEMNGRCCEFYLFYKETEMGFLKVFVNDDDTIDGYVYSEKGYGESVKLKRTTLSGGEARYLASLLKKEADGKNIWDEDISKINFDSELDPWDYIDDYEEEDEEDEEYEEDDNEW